MIRFPLRISALVGAVIAIALQIVVAPNITVFTAMPNFILCYVIVYAVANARQCGFVMPFVLGLIFDFAGSGPVGGMAFTCVVAAFVASHLFRTFDNETLFIPIAVILAACLVSEMVYALLTIACGLNVSLLEAFLYVALPCAAYDMVISLVAYPLVLRFIFRERATSEMTIIDTKMG